MAFGRNKRPLHRCRACGYHWQPRGDDVAPLCPNCGSSSVGIAPTRPPARSPMGCLFTLALLGGLGYAGVTYGPGLLRDLKLGTAAPARKPRAQAPPAAPEASPPAPAAPAPPPSSPAAPAPPPAPEAPAAAPPPAPPPPAPRREPRAALAVVSRAGGQAGTAEKPRFLLTGRVRNDGDAPAERVSVHARFFLAGITGGAPLGERDGALDPPTLRPGETGSYRIEYAGERAADVARFEVEARAAAGP
jgi:hypothetical protein